MDGWPRPTPPADRDGNPGSLTFEMQDIAGHRRPRPGHAASSPWPTTPGAPATCSSRWRHGVDISVQALTKYVGGHSDVFMGSAAARDPALVARRLEDGIHNLGWAGAAEDAYQMLRGLRTLPDPSDRRQGERGLAIAALAGRSSREVPQMHASRPARLARTMRSGSATTSAPAACSPSS